VYRSTAYSGPYRINCSTKGSNPGMTTSYINSTNSLQQKGHIGLSWIAPAHLDLFVVLSHTTLFFSVLQIYSFTKTFVTNILHSTSIGCQWSNTKCDWVWKQWVMQFQYLRPRDVDNSNRCHDLIVLLYDKTRTLKGVQKYRCNCIAKSMANDNNETLLTPLDALGKRKFKYITLLFCCSINDNIWYW
jgi:hypothetical protein